MPAMEAKGKRGPGKMGRWLISLRQEELKREERTCRAELEAEMTQAGVVQRRRWRECESSRRRTSLCRPCRAAAHFSVSEELKLHAAAHP